MRAFMPGRYMRDRVCVGVCVCVPSKHLYLCQVTQGVAHPVLVLGVHVLIRTICREPDTPQLGKSKENTTLYLKWYVRVIWKD